MTKPTTKRTTTTARSKTPPAEAAASETPVAKASPEGETRAELRKKELVDRVVAMTGLKKRDVKPALEAALVVLGDALANDEVLNLQPFGKMQVKRRKELPNGEALVTRVRRVKPSVAQEAKDPLAEAAE